MDNGLTSLADLLSIYLQQNDLDDDYMYKLKIKIKKLPTLHQHVFLQYIECNSLRKTATRFNCSQTTISNIIKQIREELNK